MTAGFIESVAGNAVAFNGCPYCKGRIEHTALLSGPTTSTVYGYKCSNCGEEWRNSRLLWELYSYLGVTENDMWNLDEDAVREGFYAEYHDEIRGDAGE